MGHRRVPHSHRYGWKVGFCSFSSLLFVCPLWVSWRKGRKAARISAPGQCSPSVSCSFSLYFSLSFSNWLYFLAFQPTAPSPILFLSLLSGRLVNSLSPCQSGSTIFTLFILIFSPPPRKLNTLQERQTALHKHSSNMTALSAVSFWNALLFEYHPFEENALCISLTQSLECTGTIFCIYTQTQRHIRLI